MRVVLLNDTAADVRTLVFHQAGSMLPAAMAEDIAAAIADEMGYRSQVVLEFNMDEGLLMWPHVVPEGMAIPVEYERVPSGELAVRRGTHVKARDGRVGRVDEFLVDPANGHITHLVLREGHLWGQGDVTIPVSEIARIEEDTVYLKLDKQQVEALPMIPIRRHRRTQSDESSQDPSRQLCTRVARSSA